MRWGWRFLVLSTLVVLSASPAPAQGIPDLVARVKPAVAIVETAAGFGTGFYVSEVCALATAAHVVQRDRTVKVHSLVPTYEAQVTGWDRDRDVAVIQGRAPCAFIPLADSDQLRQGEEILIIGYPALLGAQEREPSVTRGIISATKGRDGFLQYDAATFSGASGSPVINMTGQVVGMHSGRLAGSAIAFGAPSNWIRALVVNPVIVRSQPTFDNRIVAGDRISGIALGMTLNEASAAAIVAFGRLADTAATCRGIEEYRQRGESCHIRIWTGEGGRLAAWLMFVGRPGQEAVVMVGSSLVAHKTEEGLGRGSPLADFIKVHGDPKRGPAIEGRRGSVVATDGSPAAYWPGDGIGVFYDRADLRVWSVVVFD